MLAAKRGGYCPGPNNSGAPPSQARLPFPPRMSVSMKRQLLLLPGLVLALSLGAAPGQDKAETKYSGRTLKAWIADLKDDDVLVREEAIEVLAQVGTPAKGAA